MTKSNKLRIGILYGGKSAEHEVSLLSAKNVLGALDPERFEPVCIGIAKSGKWFLDPDQKMLAGGKPKTQVALVPGGDGELVSVSDAAVKAHLDAVFPVLHGPMGEDGTVQGALELAGIPYVGPGVLGSAVGMDKDVMKRLLRDDGLHVAEFAALTATEAKTLKTHELVKQFGLPLFVKPANMGSSVGVSKVDDEAELLPAIREALRFDTKVLIEKAVHGDEIECAVLGNDHPEASAIGRIIPKTATFYSYEAKYLDEHGAALEIPADISSAVASTAQETALRAYMALNCQGMARVDMFARPDGTIVINEINTIPGFTNISMYPKLWGISGLPYDQLITRLIDLAIERFDARAKLVTSY